MKTMKKLSALFLALVLVLAMVVVPASAATSITVNKPLADITYNVYKMFDLSYSPDPAPNGAHSYTVATGWDDFFTTGDGKNYVTITDGYVTNISDLAALAKSAAAAIPGGVSPVATHKATPAEASAGNFTIDNALTDIGYYLVTSTAGTAGMSETVNGTASPITIEEKNKLPKVDKAIGAGEYTPGSDIPFVVTVTTETGGMNYVVHDHMGDGLKFNNDVVVKIGALVIDPSNYTVTTSPVCGVATCTLEIAFDNTFIGGLTALTEIEISYSAEMLATGNYTNKATITSGGGIGGDDPSTSITPMEITLRKVDGNHNPLPGAKFKLYKMVDSIKKYATFTTRGTSSDPYIVASWGDEGEIISDVSFVIKALGAGTYYLEETQAPAGYNAISEPITIEVTQHKTVDPDTGNTTITYTTKIAGTETDTFDVVNNTGTLLPPTGGIGTPLFYTIGGILVLAALAVLISKKRAGAAQ